MKKGLFKFITIALLVSSTVVLGFGCKGLSSAEKSATKSVTLEYWTTYDDVSAIRGLLEKYTAARPFIKVNVRQYSPAEFYTRLIEALADDKGPDIISVNNKEMGKYLSKLQPMPSTISDTTMVTTQNTLGQNQTLINTAQVTLPTTRDLKNNFVQVVEKDAIKNNKIYGLPLSLDTLALYYNKDILDRAGVAEAPTSWSEFQDAAKKATKIINKDGKEQIIQSGAALGSGANVPASDDLLYVLFTQSGVSFINDNGLAVFDSAKGENSPTMGVMNFYTDFSNSARDTYSWNKDMDNALDKFAGGSLAFFFGYSYHYSQIKARGPAINFDVVALPQLNADKPVNVANYYLQTVLEKSKNSEAAWGVINYLAITANKDYLTASKRPSAQRALIAAQKDDVRLGPFVSQALIATNWYHGRNYTAAQSAIYSLLDDWVNPPKSGNQGDVESYSSILNRAASKINQSI